MNIAFITFLVIHQFSSFGVQSLFRFPSQGAIELIYSLDINTILLIRNQETMSFLKEVKPSSCLGNWTVGNWASQQKQQVDYLL